MKLLFAQNLRLRLCNLLQNAFSDSNQMRLLQKFEQEKRVTCGEIL